MYCKKNLDKSREEREWRIDGLYMCIQIRAEVEERSVHALQRSNPSADHREVTSARLVRRPPHKHDGLRAVPQRPR